MGEWNNETMDKVAKDGGAYKMNLIREIIDAEERWESEQGRRGKEEMR